MVMNNIIFVKLQLRALQLHSNDVIFTDANENCYKNFRMSYRCFGRPVSSLHPPERNRCKVRFIDVSRTWKSYARHKQPRGLLKARFIGYLSTRATSAVSSASDSSTSTRTRTKRSASNSPLASSTPRSRPPTRKRPAVVRTDRDARIVPIAKDLWRL